MSGEPLLKVGATEHDWVSYLQGVLAQQGFPGKAPDGVFDENTKQQVEAFQAHHNLHPVDGEVGEKTWAALGGVTQISEENQNVQGRSAQEMASIRTELIGIAKGRLEGHFRDVTDAVREFQIHATGEAELLRKDEGTEGWALFKGITGVVMAIIPEYEITKALIEGVMEVYKSTLEHHANSTIHEAQANILKLADRLGEQTEDSARQALASAESSLGSLADYALGHLEELGTYHQQEALELVVTNHMYVPDPARHSRRLYVLEPLMEQLASAVARAKYGSVDTPFETMVEQDREVDARVAVEQHYEHEGWRPPQ